MANKYSESLEEVRRLVQAHLGDWENIDRKVLEVVGHAQQIQPVSTNNGSIKELNAVSEAQINIQKQLNAVTAEYKVQIQALQNQITKLNAAKKGTSKTLSDEERQLKAVANSEKRLLDVKSKHWKVVEANRKAANEEAQGIRNRLSDYGQYSQQLIQMSREYKDLAIQKVRLNNLTVEEIKRMDSLGDKIGELRGQLVQVDHSVGQFGRSVGSYGKQFDSLGFSIAQITREMPAFAYGAQIGFAALSNNIPMLFDEITKVKLEMKELAAQGKATGSVMGRLGSAIFSFQSLISLGVTLLTLYGADLIEMAFGATAAEKAQEELNKAIASGEADSRSASQEMRTYVKILQDAEASLAAREGALKALKEEVTELKDVELSQKDAMQQIIDKTGPYIIAAEARAKADAFARLAAEAEAKLIEIRSKSLEDSVAWYDYITAAITNYGSAAAASYDLAAKGLENSSKEVKTQEGVVKLLNDAYSDYLQKALEAESKITDATKDGTAAKRADIEALEEMNLIRQYSIDYYGQIISALEAEQSRVSRSSSEWKKYQKSIEEAQEAIRIITDIQKWAREEMTLTGDDLDAFNIEVTTSLNTRGIENGMQELSKITGETIESLYTQMHNWYGKDFDAFLELWDAKLKVEKDGSEEIKKVRGQVVEAAIGFVGALFTAEIDKIDQRIEKNKDYYATLLAGENLTEERRAALEAERDLKERKLLKEKKKRENQQFLFEQGIALAKVAMYTAVGIAEALPNLALATLVGILGGIQAATIIALSIPKFAKGTENAPAGLAIVDEIRPEVHTDRRGRVKSYGTDQGPTLRFLEHGDKIYKSREEYLRRVGPKGIENAVFDLNMKHQGTPVSRQSMDNALLRELSALRGDNDKVWREVKKLASRPIYNNIKVEMPDKRPY